MSAVADQFERDYAAIGDVLTRYILSEPVEAQDLDTVQAALVAALPEGYRAAVRQDVRAQRVLCQIWNDTGIEIYSRFLRVRGLVARSRVG